MSPYFDKIYPKTIRKIDYRIIFSGLFDAASTPRQVVSGFLRSSSWPFNNNAATNKVTKSSATAIVRFVINFFL